MSANKDTDQSRGCLGEGVDSPSEGVDTVLVRGWTLFLVRVENFKKKISGLGHVDV